MRHQIFKQTRRIGGLLFLILLAGVCGCGHAAKVAGKVTCQGRPVQCGSVIFLSGDKTARSGVIELNGSYTVDGVLPGAVKIAVISRDPSIGRAVVRDGKRVRPDKIKGWFPLPQKFESPESSGLGCIVIAGHFNHDIELK